ncbi:MAG TPA: hypothetical protein VJG30_02655 [Candidatus Nanoarchaeia archaeon]|nr:hypothetical protein [Candidatus Nanoarchaeia archaeon]
MEDYTLILKDLLKKDLSEIQTQGLSENLKKEFEKTAENFIQKEFYEDAIKTFAITKNFERLEKLGNELILKNKLNYALKSFLYSKNKEGLDKVGMALISNGDVKEAYLAFKNSDNIEMIKFIEKNLL